MKRKNWKFNYVSCYLNQKQLNSNILVAQTSKEDIAIFEERVSSLVETANEWGKFIMATSSVSLGFMKFQYVHSCLDSLSALNKKSATHSSNADLFC